MARVTPGGQKGFQVQFPGRVAAGQAPFWGVPEGTPRDWGH